MRAFVSRAAASVLGDQLTLPLDRADEAIMAMDKLVSLDPDDPSALASRGVLLARRKLERAHADADAALEAAEKPITILQVGCIYSLASRQQADAADRAVQLIAKALKKDPSLVNIAARDPDLAPLHDNASFRRLIGAAQALQRASQ